MNVAEDVELRLCTGDIQKELSAAHVPVQIEVGRTMGDEEVDIRRQFARDFQVRPCRDAVEFDSVVHHSFVLQVEDSAGDKIPRANRVLFENTVMVAWNKDSKFRRYGVIPLEEVLQRLRAEALTGVTGADENVGVGRNAEAPVHPMSIGESEDPMAFVLDEHYKTISYAISK